MKDLVKTAVCIGTAAALSVAVAQTRNQSLTERAEVFVPRCINGIFESVIMCAKAVDVISKFMCFPLK